MGVKAPYIAGLEAGTRNLGKSDAQVTLVPVAASAGLQPPYFRPLGRQLNW